MNLPSCCIVCYHPKLVSYIEMKQTGDLGNDHLLYESNK